MLRDVAKAEAESRRGNSHLRWLNDAPAAEVICYMKVNIAAP